MVKHIRQQSYMIARTPSGRVTVQHKVGQAPWYHTNCGYDMTPWSIAYMSERYEAIACRKPGCKEQS